MAGERLSLCGSLVTGGVLCDVGTDHAYLPIELIKTQRISRAVACDINESPLASGRSNAQRAGVSDRIEFVLSDGLDSVELADVTDIVIAGMGGELIFSILSRHTEKLRDKNLILQPMTRADFLREKLYGDGYKIVREETVSEDGRIYCVMQAKYTGVRVKLSPYVSFAGFADMSSEQCHAYADSLINTAEKIHSGMLRSASSKHSQYDSFARKIRNRKAGICMITIDDVMAEMDRIAPLALLDGDDNSGLIIEGRKDGIAKILLALDITKDVADEAVRGNYDVVISHHPLIYNPIYRIKNDTPEVILARAGINGICFHSPLDLARGGINDILCRLFAFDNIEDNAFEYLFDSDVYGERERIGYGKICVCEPPVEPAEMAYRVKNALGCEVLPYVDGGRPIKRIALCSGGGGSLIKLAAEKGCDGYISSDFKHDQYIFARNNGISLFDGGHFRTEDVAVPYLKECLSANLPGVIVDIAQSDTDPRTYAV